MASAGATPVRGTQSFVHTLSACWRRPSLTALEVLWRWVYGVPALALLFVVVRSVVSALTEGTFDAAKLGLDRSLLDNPVGALSADPLSAASKFSSAFSYVLSQGAEELVWMAPTMIGLWVVLSSIGRTLVLRRADPEMRIRPVTLMWLHLLRTTALLASFALWFACLRAAGTWAVSGPVAMGQEPNLVLFCAVAIVATLGLFTLWAVLSWPLTVAPLLAMLLDLDVGGSLAAAFRLGPLPRSKLVEINMVMGIVKIALIVLAMVFSATPLPFESVATPEFMEWWYAGVAVLYFVASDFFHVARLVAYMRLWRAYERPDDLAFTPVQIVHLMK